MAKKQIITFTFEKERKLSRSAENKIREILLNEGATKINIDFATGNSDN